MRLIVGFGNPGSQYNWTRHNFGFLTLDFYAKKHNLEWRKEKMGGIWARSGDTIFLKPQQFYNESGPVVQKFAQFYKISPADILIICDDFNLPFGSIRYRAKGSDGGNNGLKSTISALGSNEIPRLRLGSDNALRSKIGDIDFVLGRFTAEEKAALPALLTEISEKISTIKKPHE